MTSNINYVAINENFPVAGQDNDTQVFRDNFDTIKTSLRAAQEEISDLQNNVARTDVDNDFNQKLVESAVFKNCRDRFFDAGTDFPSSTILVSLANGAFQQYRLTQESTLVFTDFPADTTGNPTQVGKVLLELYAGSQSSPVGTIDVNLDLNGNVTYKKSGNFTGNKFQVTSPINPTFLEVWRHSDSVIFVRNLGLFT